VARHVALLRGINVGRNKRIGMADLRAMLEELGYEDVRTLLQSGNAVFGAAGKPDAVARNIEGAIAERFGMEVGVVVRTAQEMADVVAANPLGDVATGGAKQHVIFLSAEPDAAALAAIADPAPEAFAACGREIHVWCPDGLQASALIKALSKPVIAPGAIATVRNWNTVTKLAALAGEG
jgi:uncharacterized protein (DUF1697 family)